MSERFIRSTEYRARLGGISRMTEWRLQRDDEDFPKPIKLRPNLVVYRESECEAYIAKKAGTLNGEAA